MLCKAQNELEGESWIGHFALQIRNTIAQDVCDEAHMLADEALEREFMEKVDHMLKALM